MIFNIFTNPKVICTFRAYFIRMIRWICYLYAKLTGWKIDSKSYKPVPKALFVQAPHTSNWDFPIGIYITIVLKQNIRYLGKSSLFKWPYGSIFRKLGGYPVDRTGNVKFVDAAIGILNKHKEFLLHISPEGTRKKVEKIRSGWYYIAKGANVPIILCKFDWDKKLVTFSDPYYIEGTYEEELGNLKSFFRGTNGKNPELGWPY